MTAFRPFDGSSRLKPTGRLLVRRSGSEQFEYAGGYTDLKISVEDSIEGGDEPIALEVTKGLFLAVDEVGSPEWLPSSPSLADSKTALDVIRDAGIRRLEAAFDASERYMLVHGHRMPIEHGHRMHSEPDPRLNRRARRAMARKAVSR